MYIGGKGGGEDGGIARIPGTLSARRPDYEKWWLSQVSLSPPEGLIQYAEILLTLDMGPFISQNLPPVLILAHAKKCGFSFESSIPDSSGGPPCSLVAFMGKVMKLIATNLIHAFLPSGSLRGTE